MIDLHNTAAPSSELSAVETYTTNTIKGPTRSADRRAMNVNVILTFDVDSEWEERQEFFDIKLPVNTKELNAILFIHRKLFWRIAKKCQLFRRYPKRLIKISTAANWGIFAQKTGKPTLCDLGHPCKWWFGTGRHDLDDWEKTLMAEFGFGVDVDMSFVNSRARACALPSNP